MGSSFALAHLPPRPPMHDNYELDYSLPIAVAPSFYLLSELASAGPISVHILSPRIFRVAENDDDDRGKCK